MTLAHYDYLVSEDFLSYEFFSEGPKGKIRKVVLFSRVNLYGKFYFNLAFGDFNEAGNFNDLVISNNQDAEKVLATVAQAVIKFTNVYPEALIVAEGSTPSRTRRYQMGINKFLKEIELDFKVFGLLNNGGFEPFRSGENYKAFAVTRKNINFI
ncbi:hypothetical protein FAM09_12815 [Niastella caeni]|uniref:Uncharacterized protein n=1 Tax=Niastella caeni TaxID=2569763 RepID=A0A4S8HUU5_9BACT|nr:hypothetical protein [Niastella caeni]THU39383.1 hypothetical protein FAM09_12815 [Niastella caeni]